MGPLVVDIETAGQFHELTQPVQEYLIEREKRRMEEAGEGADPISRSIDNLPLNPAAGIIVSIGMWLINEEKGLVLVNNVNDQTKHPTGHTHYDEQVVVFYGSEARILEVFWAKVIEKAGTGGRRATYPIVTYNGRMFDGPFLMLRSAINGVRPTRNLIGYRYNLQDNCDLMEVLTFMGALPWQHRYSLDFWCHQFGIESPKQDMDGSQVGEVWRAGDLQRLIKYSIADIKATAQLYTMLEPMIAIMME